MRAADVIKTTERVVPMIYAYTTPGVDYHKGWTKIGYTERQSVADRIAQQTHTAGIRAKLLWTDNAMYKDGSGDYFKDYDFHSFLTARRHVEREPKTEWFHVDGPTSRTYFDEFASRDYLKEKRTEGTSYILRREQADAVAMTKAYFEKGGTEFLWNAKPRFGKTLTAYDLIRKMKFTKVLVVTNRPSIANSWAEDFNKFIAWQTDLSFVSDSDALKDADGVMTKEEFNKSLDLDPDNEGRGFVAFISLQDLKGSAYMGGKYDKLQWVSQLPFDLLIVDESQEGVLTKKTERAFGQIHRAHTLYLSGTPFRQLASEEFSASQIYNWTYADEQEAKAGWKGDGYNPYENLPKLSMFTYQMSPMIEEQITHGADISDDENAEYAFDLAEFFRTNESGKFVHEEDVRKFLRSLYTGDKYPFSTPELREELSHTLWLLNRVLSAKALAKLLHEDPVFKDYEVILAAGDGKLEDAEKDSGRDDAANQKSFNRVTKAIAEHDKTITLSVGQLTVGVTIKPWTAVLMLCNLKSASSYMQAAFRAQNPYEFTRNGKRYRKENAYVFDFDPARTLILFDQFANDVSKETVDGGGTTEERKANIRRLLNFFPVLGEDKEGTMVELDAAAVLSIPRKIKSEEVVRRGFLSNFLFTNISNIFGAPGVVKEILAKLTPAHEDQVRHDHIDDLDKGDIPLNEEGEVDIPRERVIGTATDIFGPKIYDSMAEDLDKPLADVMSTTPPEEKELKDRFTGFQEQVADTITSHVMEPLADTYGLNKAQQKKMEKEIHGAVKEKISKVQDDYLQGAKVAKLDHDHALRAAEKEEDVKAADTAFAETMKNLISGMNEGLKQAAQEVVRSKPTELVERMEEKKAEDAKKKDEDTVRDHLRGFSRAIPSFLMAYGDEKLTLANLDDYTEDDVFEEVTGITEEEFRFLRDGGDRKNSETGEVEHFKGHLFDAVVFDDSVQEFLRKKKDLANYFDEEQTEDIFDYIPPQRTNQIFTPRWVVEKMVDELEEENPGCFDDPNATFADLYMKSGLYITEIVKRLYRSPKMKELYPLPQGRIRHILSTQVYGMAPSRIIYLIATHFILGFDEKLSKDNPHFVQEDAAKAAKEGRLAEVVEAHWGI